MTHIRVSALVAVRDGEQYLGETLSSILSQTRPVDEVIVVDDGSSDGSADLARSFGAPVTVIETPHRGVGAARNTAIAAATGQVIALCDADDLWHPDKIECQLDLVDDPEQPIAVFCSIEEFVSPELDPADIPGRQPFNEVASVRLASALLATRAALQVAGPFAESTTVGDWVEWCVRMSTAVPVIKHHPNTLVGRRLHDTNHSLATEGRSRVWASALADHIRRQRESG
jgi:glycosyltransferase involved in cell wall biosynthesis